ncbi:MAG: DNA primase [Holosporales bacterium]|jgi:DNA primase|nr:DNA primase [Holosporales bacterium]
MSLHELISRDVRLQRKGADFWGCCPFHKEKTPSFKVDVNMGFFHCFGCGAHGDTAGYIMKKHGVGFRDALIILEEQYGIHLPGLRATYNKKIEGPHDNKKQTGLTLRELMEKAAARFHDTLKTSRQSGAAAARRYLLGRGISEETINKFRIGYCDNTITDFLRSIDGVDAKMLDESGLITTRNGRDFARFAGRVIFPICDGRGRVIAFGGRIVEDVAVAKEPVEEWVSRKGGFAKYVNSPETPLFHKGDTLFNLHNAFAGAKTSELVIVEGYMDVISLSQHGFPQTVAPLGTAMTEAQIKKAWIVSHRPILCFDGDTAGQRAAQRAAMRCLPILEAGKSLFFCFLPSGLDPDEFVGVHGVEGFQKLLEHTLPLVDVLWKVLLQRYCEGSSAGQPPQTKLIPEDLAALKKDILTTVRSIPNPEIQKSYGFQLQDKLFAFLRESRKIQKNSARDFDHTGSSHRRVSAPTASLNPGKEHFPSAGRGHSNELNLADLAHGCSGHHNISQKILLGILLIEPILLQELDELLIQTDFGNAELDMIKSWLLGAHFANIEVTDQDFINQRDVFLKKIGMGLLRTHAGFLFKDGVSVDEKLKRWLDIWRISAGQEGAKKDFAHTADLLKKNSGAQSLERIKDLLAAFYQVQAGKVA